LRDAVDHYVHPPARAIVLSVDEKNERHQPITSTADPDKISPPLGARIEC
jgi:hypothetical protein